VDHRTESDISQAEHLIRTHCPIDWPQGRRCLNCANSFPCPVNLWAYELLTAAGRSEEQILRLDSRTGPWS
jgi:hypothetical protein